MNRKNKTSKMHSPLVSPSSSGSEDNELPNQLKNLIEDDMPKRKKKFFSNQIQPVRLRPSIVQRALRKNIVSSTPSKNLGKLFFPSDSSSYSPIDHIETDVEIKLKRKKYSDTNLTSDSITGSVKNRLNKSTLHTSRYEKSQIRKKKSALPELSCLFDDEDKNTSPMRLENRPQTRKKKSDLLGHSCLFDDEDKNTSPMRPENKSQTRKKVSDYPENSCLVDDKDKNTSHVHHSNMSQGDKINSICNMLRRKSETNKDDNYKRNSLRIIEKTTKSLNNTHFKNSHIANLANFSIPNNTVNKRSRAGTQNDFGTINTEDNNNCKLHRSDCNKNKFRNSIDNLDTNETLKENSQNSRNNTPLLSKINRHTNSNTNFSYQNVTLRKSNVNIDKNKSPTIQIVDTSNSDSDSEPLAKKMVSKIPVLRSRSKSQEKYNKSTKSKMEESILPSQLHKSSNEKVPNTSNKVPVEYKESENNNCRSGETSSTIAAKQKGNSFESGAATSTDISNLTKYIDGCCCNIYESVKEGSIVERFSSGYDHNVLENHSINKPWRYSISSSNIDVPNFDGLKGQMISEKLLLRKSEKPSIKRYPRALSSVMHRSPSNSNNSLDEVSSRTKDSSFVELPTKINNKNIEDRSDNESISDKIEKWLTDIRHSQSKIVPPEECSNIQINEIGNSQTKSDHLHVTNRTRNTDDNKGVKASLLKKPFRKPQNQSDKNEENFEENHEKSKNSVKKTTKKSRKSLRVLLKNDRYRKSSVNTIKTSPINKSRKKPQNDPKARKNSANTIQTSPINKLRQKTQSDSKENKVHCERNEENGESSEEDDETSKKSVKKIKSKTRKSLRILLKMDNIEKQRKKNQIDSKTDDEKLERNEKNYETNEENCDRNDEITTPNKHDDESTKPVQEESVNKGNTNRPVRNRRPPPLGIYSTMTIQSTKYDQTLWVVSRKEDITNTICSTITRKNKTTETTKKNNLTSKKRSSSNLSKKKETVKKPVLKNKRLLLDSLDSNARNLSAVPENSVIPRNSAILENSYNFPERAINPAFSDEESGAASKKSEGRNLSKKKETFKKPILKNKRKVLKNSEYPENSCDFPEGAIHPVFSDEENHAVSEMFTNHSNNNCLETNDNQENQPTKFDDFLMPPPQKPTDHDSGTSTMMDENVSRINKKSTSARGRRNYNKPASRKTINKNTRSSGISKPLRGDECRNIESLGILSPPLEDESIYRKSLRKSDLLETEYVELTDNNGINRLKFLEKSANFAEMADKLIYSDSFNYGTDTSIIYLQIPPCKEKSLYISRNHNVFYVVLEGHGRILVSNKHCPVERLSRFMVPKGLPYSIRNESQTEKMLLVCFRVSVP